MKYKVIREVTDSEGKPCGVGDIIELNDLAARSRAGKVERAEKPKLKGPKNKNKGKGD